MLNSSWLFCCTIHTYIHIPYITIQLRLRIYFLELNDCNCDVILAHGTLYVWPTERAGQRWDTESEEEREARFRCQWGSDTGRQLQDTETEDKQEARLHQWREIAEVSCFGPQFIEHFHIWLTSLHCLRASYMNQNFRGSNLIAESLWSSPPDDHHLSSHTY